MPERIPVAKVFIRNEEGELLVVREEESGQWELPGGFIEEDEDRFEAVSRELKEETSLEASEFEDVIRLELEDEKIIEFYGIYTESFDGEPEPGGEVDKIKWVTPEQFIQMDWHRDSAYNIVPMMYLEDYRETEKDYSGGDEIDVVKVLVMNDEGKFLAVQKTAENKIHSGHKYTLYGRMAGKWELPGGRFKESSGRFEAAKREIKEECGIEIKNLKDVMREETEEVNSVNAYIVFTDEWEGEIELSKEHQDFRWVTPKEYLHLDWHQDAGYGFPPMEFLDEYMEKGKKDY